MTNDRHQPPCLLQTKGLTKRFGSLVANRDISLEVNRGTIHAILGENGAGKSTLMKMLYGVYQPDGGEIRIDGEPAQLHPPTKARAKGIGMVFQDFRVVPALTVLDNIALSVESGWFLKRKRLRQRIVDISAKYGLAVDPDAYVWQLDLGQRQRLEIVKVLLAPGTRIIIFDEPTSVLVPQEVESFLGMLRMLRNDGYGILLITHKINEVLAVADQVTVLRSGEATYSATRTDGLDGETLIGAMMANKALQTVSKAAARHSSNIAASDAAAAIAGSADTAAMTAPTPGGSTRFAESGPFAGGDPDDSAGTEPLPGDHSDGSIKTELLAGGSDDSVETEPLAGGDSADSVETEPLAGGDSADSVETEPLAGGDSAVLAKMEPLTRSDSAVSVKTGPLAGDRADGSVEAAPSTSGGAVKTGGETTTAGFTEAETSSVSPVLELANATIKGDHGETILDRLSLELHRGRITGVAGISGSGQRELAEVLFGLRKPAAGRLTVQGRELQGGPRAFIEAGVTFVSEDPIKESVIPGFTILEHMVLDGIAAPHKGPGIDWADARRQLDASPEAKALALAASSRRADTLSGGNVQRMVLTRALIRKPDILIISYPSRGLDIGTTRTIQQHLLELAGQGTAILLFSEDLDELFTLSDDLVVLSGKRLLGPYPAANTDVSRIGSLMLEGESA